MSLHFWYPTTCPASQHQFFWGIPHGPGVRDMPLGSASRVSALYSFIIVCFGVVSAEF